MWGIPKEKLTEFAAFLCTDYAVIAPVKQKNTTAFALFADNSELFLADRPHYGPKQFLFADNEEMFRYSRGRVHCAPGKRTKPYLIFLARPCDANAVEVLDEFFLSGFKDPYYAEKRDGMALVALLCASPCENGFCHSVGANNVEKFDLALWESGNHYAAMPGSLRGDRMISESGLFVKIPHSEQPEVKGSLRVDDNPVINERTLEREAARCFACAACTAVCPTCTCFEIADEKELRGKRESVRKRRWDWCMSSDFSTISGICFRSTKRAMLRQFVNHKLRDFKKEYGRHMCVGCGRCISHCPAHISIVNLVRKDDAPKVASGTNVATNAENLKLKNSAKKNAKAEPKASK